ncbi:YeeE/YedE family protein [Hyphomicrobium sp. DMF-1]|uniref:YeeE/YedE family protein n=1 Tax=Hyphomicrobium sp. DMF-1 TaxID=3019544 RepID=UPI0022EC02E2|nr:YeeE/YedE thiosulfate transporter family protein [Hyphomicrobium sp. DMF-1]WBT38009.1 YeeE/YedE thiosulfate transporter family protein [Hyphomicrobium sp. DMF-1]
MTEFTPLTALAGGSLIGLSAVMLMLFNGRIAGMTGMLTGLLAVPSAATGWRLAFIAGSIFAPIAMMAATGFSFDMQVATPLPMLALGGLIVGIGVTMASGCTSGHGVCGLARFSPRSLVAVVSFMASTAMTVFVIRHVGGG